MHNLDLQNL